ncbi:MAG TPA: ABC-F family ATP-binding cassette domain-containing protein, partial [Fibrobacter sp.]|nr:ABC-F family ATP-binding cassette domain-containing protein [Fibrobacter sp.]
MALLSVQNLKLTFGGPPLLDGVSFDVEAGERICLIGRNGEGKSTLFKILLREMTADEGDIVCQTGLRLARLVQEIPPHIEGTVRDIILEDQNGERNAAKEAVLGRSGIDPDALYDSLSGGQKRRVLFAKALAAEPDILLLD